MPLFASQNMGNDSEFEEGRILGHAQEQRRLANYFHNQLGPDPMALAFEIESIRAPTGSRKPSVGAEGEVRDRLSEILAPGRDAILSQTGDGSKSAE